MCNASPVNPQPSIKMKYLLIVCFSLFSLSILPGQDFSSGSPLPVNEEGIIMYRAVMDEPGASDSLYLRAINWLNTEFANPWDVSRTRNREDGVLSGIARLSLYTSDEAGNTQSGGLVEYTFTIECRDDRYRYTFTDFLHKRSSRFPLERWLDKSDPQWAPVVDTYLDQVHQEMSLKIESLKAGMKPAPKVVDEW